MTDNPKFYNYSSKMGKAPKFKEPQKKTDHIEQLVEERDTARRLLGAAMQMQTDTQAKLAKAVETLQILKPLLGDSWVDRRVLAVLAELEDGE